MIELSAIVVVGPLRTRSQRVVDALCNQTARERIEVIVVDVAAEEIPPLAIGNGAQVQYLRRADLTIYNDARCAGVRAAKSPVIAFIEDHCVPEPGWAAALIEAHKGPWAAVGYAFINPDPENFWCRATMVNDYGLWLDPCTREPLELMPGNNISYKRTVLMELGDELEAFLTPDYNLQQKLLRSGRTMRAEPDAKAAHQGFKSLKPAMQANFSYARLLAARRSKLEGWSVSRRLLQALATPVLGPLLGCIRLIRSLRGRSALLGQVVEGLPIYFVIHSWSSVGEMLGYVFGEGTSERDWNDFELLYDRD